MMQKQQLTHLEQAILHIKHMTDDEKITLAKFLALDQGVRMYTHDDAKKITNEEVETRVRRELNNYLRKTDLWPFLPPDKHS